MNGTGKKGGLLTETSLFKLTPLEVMVIIAIVGLLAVILGTPPTSSIGPKTHQRLKCRNNLKQIGLALHNYHDQHGVFPPAFTVDAEGKPLHSWRTLILPYLDQAALYDSIDLSKPWDDPTNAQAKETATPCYSCPSTVLPKGMTTYVCLVGEQTFFSLTHPRKHSELPPGKSSQLIAILERDEKRAVHWMSPEDGTAAELLTPQAGRKTVHTGGCHVLMADGNVRFLNNVLSEETLKSLIFVDAPLVDAEF